MNSLIQINDWEIKKFLKVILAVQFAMWGVIGLDVIGLRIPIIRQLIGFIYLTFVPGILILRILKLHKLGNIETLLYTVGLSIAFLIFTGLFMNTVYPFFGISGPISLVPLIITISVIVLVLCVISYIRDKKFSDPSFIDVGDVLSPPTLFLCLIPFLSIFGTYLMNFHDNNILLMFLIVIIALIVLLIAFDKFIPKNLYPFAVFVIAISLLYHTWLISPYIWGRDIHSEYYFSNLVIISSHWDSTILSNTNAMLNTVIFAPICSNICSISLTWVYKIIYPSLCSLIPLGLYRVYQKQIDDKIAFFSCFFFVSIGFYTIWLISAKQLSAELFVVLLILLMIKKDMNNVKRAFLSIVFGISLVVTHYGTSYIYMFCLILAWLILILAENPEMQKLKDGIHSKIGRYKSEKLVGNPISLKIGDRTISSTLVLLFITFTLTWYMYVSSSSALDTIVRTGDHIASSILTDFLNPEAAEGLDLLLTKPISIFSRIHKNIHLLTQFFIGVGVLTLLIRRKEIKFEKEYAAFAMISFLICILSIVLPHFSSTIYTLRLYNLTLLILAPLCVIGGITFFRLMKRIIRSSWTNKSVKNTLKVLSVLFVMLFLFEIGFVDVVTKNPPSSIPLCKEQMVNSENIKYRAAFYYDHNVFKQDVYGVKWLSKNMKEGCIIYSDKTAASLYSYGMSASKNRKMLSNTTTKVESEAYIYLGYSNIIGKVLYNLVTPQGQGVYSEINNIEKVAPLLNRTSKIYLNGGSEIYQG